MPSQGFESRRAISDLERPSSKSSRASTSLRDAVRGRPRRVPILRAWEIPARMRSRSTSRSNSANTERRAGHGATARRQAEYMEKTTGLVRTLRDVALAYVSDGTSEERLRAIGSLLEPDIEQLLRQCEEHAALVSGNQFRLLPPLFRQARGALLLLLENLPLEPTTQDDSVQKAIAFVLANKTSRSELLPITGEDSESEVSDASASVLSLSFVPDNWWPLVTRTKNRTIQPTHVDRQFFELCVLSQVATDLKSNDLCIPLGAKLGDYRERLVPWETYHREVNTYGERMNIPVRPEDFTARLRADLDTAARAADEGFPENRHLRIENGEPVLSPVRADPDPIGLSRMEQLMRERMEPVEILDALVDTEHWLNWTRYFGPLSGFDAKVAPTGTVCVNRFLLRHQSGAGADRSFRSRHRSVQAGIHQSTPCHGSKSQRRHHGRS